MKAANPQSGSEPNLRADCEMMLRFALDEGTELGEALQGQIAALDRWLKINGQPTISGLPSSLISDAVAGGETKPQTNAPTPDPIISGLAPSSIANPSAGGEPKQSTTAPVPDPIAQLFQVHGQLAKLVSPATPYSLRATHTERRGFGRMMDMPIIVRLAIAAAAICMLGFIVTLCGSVWADPSISSKRSAADSSNTNSATGTVNSSATIPPSTSAPPRVGYPEPNGGQK